MRTSIFFSLLTPLLLAFQAHAATLVATTDHAIYQQGDLVTITLVGTTVGAGPGISEPTDTSELIDVRIDITGHGGAFTEVSTGTGQGGDCVQGSSCLPSDPYTVGGTQGTTLLGNYIAFSQIGGLTPVPQTAGMETLSPGFFQGNGVVTAVFTTIAGPEGVYPIELAEGVTTPFPLNPVCPGSPPCTPPGQFIAFTGFFGITGPQTLGSYRVIPEPTTAALMGLGLLGLAVAGRR